MEPQGSLTCAQEPAACRYPEPDESNPHYPILRLSYAFQYYPPIYAWVLEMAFFFRFPHQNYLLISVFPHMYCWYLPSHTLELMNNILLPVQITQLFVTQFSPASCYLILGLNIFLHIIYLNILSLCYSIKVRQLFSKQYQTTGKIIVPYIVIFLFLYGK
jgi:hypothetical protein